MTMLSPCPPPGDTLLCAALCPSKLTPVEPPGLWLLKSQRMGGPGAGGGVTSSQPLTTAAPCFPPLPGTGQSLDASALRGVSLTPAHTSGGEFHLNFPGASASRRTPGWHRAWA